MDKLSQAAKEGKANKSTGKEGGQPTQAEGGATAPPKGNPQSPTTPKVGTSTDNPADPTDNPQDPQAGDNPGLEEYVGSYMQAAQDWFDNVQESKSNAYMELQDTLLELGKPHIKGLDKADGKAVLASIADKSGQFLSEVDKSSEIVLHCKVATFFCLFFYLALEVVDTLCHVNWPFCQKWKMNQSPLLFIKPWS